MFHRIGFSFPYNTTSPYIAESDLCGSSTSPDCSRRQFAPPAQNAMLCRAAFQIVICDAQAFYQRFSPAPLLVPKLTSDAPERVNSACIIPARTHGIPAYSSSDRRRQARLLIVHIHLAPPHRLRCRPALDSQIPCPTVWLFRISRRSQTSWARARSDQD